MSDDTTSGYDLDAAVLTKVLGGQHAKFWAYYTREHGLPPYYQCSHNDEAAMRVVDEFVGRGCSIEIKHEIGTTGERYAWSVRIGGLPEPKYTAYATAADRSVAICLAALDAVKIEVSK